MFKKLNPLLHNELRLAIISYLATKKEAGFSELKSVTKASAGNLSVQIKKLEAAAYITVEKSFKNNYPYTKLSIEVEGIKAFKAYLAALRTYF